MAARSLRVRIVAAAHEEVTSTLDESFGTLVRERRHAHLPADVLARRQRHVGDRLAVQPCHEAHTAVEVHEEHRQPDRRQLDDAEAELGSSLEHAVHDQIGDRERGRHPQEHRRQHRVRRLGITGVPGFVERPLLVGDVEHGRHVVLDECCPGAIKIGMRERAAVDERRCDHRQADSAGGQRGELLIEPVEVAQGQVRDRVQPATAVGRHVDGPPVPRAHVGLRCLEVVDEVVLPDQAVVREQECLVESETVELGEARRRLPVRGREGIVVGPLGRLPRERPLEVGRRPRRSLPARSRRRGPCAARAIPATRCRPGRRRSAALGRGGSGRRSRPTASATRTGAGRSR